MTEATIEVRGQSSGRDLKNEDNRAARVAREHTQQRAIQFKAGLHRPVRTTALYAAFEGAALGQIMKAGKLTTFERKFVESVDIVQRRMARA